ncbi:hypothetical protein P7A61_11140 [Clostridium perfringens]|nr:hypothetical protein [Clostridium perfringens]
MKKIYRLSIEFYFILILFYGIIVRITIENNFLFSIKTIIPEITLLTICILSLISILKNKKINKITIIGILYLSILIFFNLKTSLDSNIVYFFRDWFISFIYLTLVINYNVSKNEKQKIIEKLVKIFIVFIVFGFLLAVLQKYFGWQWTSKFYTGYEFYGLDEKSKIKIWTSSGVLRVPSLTGNSVSFAFYNLIGFILLNHGYKGKFFKLILEVLTFINILLSNNKTAMIIFIILTLYFIFIKANKYFKILILDFFIIISFVIVYYLDKIDTKIFFSMKERFIYWENIFNSKDLIDIFLPRDIFNSSILVFDNFYIASIFMIGVIGVLVFGVIMYYCYKNTNQHNRGLSKELLIVFLVTSITTNISQGRSYLMPFLVIYVLLSQKDILIDKESVCI